MELKLTPLQAFNAMTSFLDVYYRQTFSDDIGSLLGDMSFLIDDNTADSATWEDWMEVIQVNGEMSLTEAFNAMIRFLNDYANRTSSEEISKLITDMQSVKNKTCEQNLIWNTWISCINNVLKKIDSKKYLTFKK